MPENEMQELLDNKYVRVAVKKVNSENEVPRVLIVVSPKEDNCVDFRLYKLESDKINYGVGMSSRNLRSVPAGKYEVEKNDSMTIEQPVDANGEHRFSFTLRVKDQAGSVVNSFEGDFAMTFRNVNGVCAESAVTRGFCSFDTQPAKSVAVVKEV